MQIPNRKAPEIPPKLWQRANKTDDTKIARVTLPNSSLNRLKNIPLKRTSSTIGEKITTETK